MPSIADSLIHRAAPQTQWSFVLFCSLGGTRAIPFMFSSVGSSLADIRRQAKKEASEAAFIRRNVAKDREVGQLAPKTETDANTRSHVTKDSDEGQMSAANTVANANSSRDLMDYFDEPHNVGGVLTSTSIRVNPGTSTGTNRDPSAESSSAHLARKVPVQMPMGGWVRMQWRKGDSSPHLAHTNACKLSQTGQTNMEQTNTFARTHYRTSHPGRLEHTGWLA